MDSVYQLQLPGLMRELRREEVVWEEEERKKEEKQGRGEKNSSFYPQGNQEVKNFQIGKGSYS